MSRPVYLIDWSTFLDWSTFSTDLPTFLDWSTYLSRLVYLPRLVCVFLGLALLVSLKNSAGKGCYIYKAGIAVSQKRRCARVEGKPNKTVDHDKATRAEKPSGSNGIDVGKVSSKRPTSTAVNAK